MVAAKLDTMRLGLGAQPVTNLTPLGRQENTMLDVRKHAVKELEGNWGISGNRSRIKGWVLYVEGLDTKAHLLRDGW